jgi:hypothetical protein
MGGTVTLTDVSSLPFRQAAAGEQLLDELVPGGHTYLLSELHIFGQLMYVLCS